MMLLSWTFEGATTIRGLQGRYYLPILSITLILITKSLFKDIKLDEKDIIKYKVKCLKFFL